MIHLFKGNRYDSVRTDGARVVMQIIACQELRCQLPKGHKATAAYSEITCHECLKVMLQEFIEKASFCNYTLKNSDYVKPEGFRFPKFVRGKREPRFEPDQEIIDRITRGM